LANADKRDISGNKGAGRHPRALALRKTIVKQNVVFDAGHLNPIEPGVD